MDYTTMVAWASWNLAIALLVGEEFDEAAVMNRRSLELMIADGYREGTASAADLCSVMWIHRGDIERGLHSLGAANQVWDSLGAVRWPEAQYLVDAALEAVTASQGAAELDRLLAEGAKLDYGEMVALLTAS